MGFRDLVKNMIPYGIIHSCEMNKDTSLPLIDMPLVYNKNGNKMRVYYLKDSTFPFWPYSATAGGVSNYILWDRANYGLKYHFYTHNDIFKQVGNPVKKYAIQLEGETSMPELYDKLSNDPRLVSDYEIFFTHNDKLLQKLPNAKPIVYGGVWFGTSAGGGEFDNHAFEKKKRNISMMASNKTFSEFHKLRYELALKYDKDARVDCYGSFRNGNPEKVAASLTDYRYSIALECEMSEYFITEKVLNCFAAMTVPIYVGTHGISRYFNMDGIIYVDPKEIGKLDEIIDRCCIEDYQERREAIIDNYNRVQHWLSFEDWLFENYKDILPE